MDMSYKRAWDLVDEINRICGQAAVARQTGGGAVRKDLRALRTDIGRPKKSLDL